MYYISDVAGEQVLTSSGNWHVLPVTNSIELVAFDTLVEALAFCRGMLLAGVHGRPMKGTERD